MKKNIIQIALLASLASLSQFQAFSENHQADLYDQYRSGTLSFRMISSTNEDTTGFASNLSYQFHDTQIVGSVNSSIDLIKNSDYNYLSIGFSLAYVLDYGEWHLVPQFSFSQVKYNDFNYYTEKWNSNSFALTARTKMSESSILNIGISSTGISEAMNLWGYYYPSGRTTGFFAGIQSKISQKSYINLGITTADGTTSFSLGFTGTY